MKKKSNTIIKPCLFIFLLILIFFVVIKPAHADQVACDGPNERCALKLAGGCLSTEDKIGDCYVAGQVCCKPQATTPSTPALSTPNWKWVIPDLQIKIPGLAKFSAPTNCTMDEKGMPANCEINWINQYVAGIYNYAIGIVGILAAVVLMFGGLLWLTAGGNATQVGEAKAWIGASLTGLVIALTSFMVLNQINPALTNQKGMDISSVPAYEIPSVINGSESKYGQTSIVVPVSEDQLVSIKNFNCKAQDCRTTKETANALQLAVQIAKSQGVELEIYSANRTISYQQKLYNAALVKYKGDEEKTSKYVAKPTISAPHVQGIAIDLCIKGSCNGIGQGESAANVDKKLSDIMHKAGFSRYCTEWWHFELKTKSKQKC